ncbi:MAG: PCRF domain-containing protein, partial [Planctomycetota bacterium]
MGATNFWDNQETAQETVGQLKSLKTIIAPMSELLAAGEDLDALLEMAEEDPEIASEIESEISRLEKELDALEL